ncbi:hypothetical protein Agub_g2352, partial [Astrephomene gubernaculifera]
MQANDFAHTTPCPDSGFVSGCHNTSTLSQPAPMAISPLMQWVSPSGADESPSPPAVNPYGILTSFRLPVTAASPTQSSWCSVSNLIAVGLTPEPGNSTAQIMVMEPSNPEDCTSFKLPLTGPGDYISHMEWSPPGQRRALLCATASGRVFVWTQPSQQGQDDSVFPRCVDDWHGQLLHDASSTSANSSSSNKNIRTSSSNRSLVGAGGAAGGSGNLEGHLQEAQRGRGVKAEPLEDGAVGADVAGASNNNTHGNSLAQQQQQQLPAFACVCWLRQPPSGRSWRTSELAAKRLPCSSASSSGAGVGAGSAGGGGGSGGGEEGAAKQQQQALENFDTLFCEDALVPGAVPHWARPHQLTAAVLTSNGSLTLLWTTASKLPNTLSWHRSKTLTLPPPLPSPSSAAATNAVAVAAAATGTGPHPQQQQQQSVAVRYASISAAHDGTLAIAAVLQDGSSSSGATNAGGSSAGGGGGSGVNADGGSCGNGSGSHATRVVLYCMRGNPTLSGQPVPQTPGATATAAAAAAAGAATSSTPTGSRREAPLPTLEPQAELDVPPGLDVRQCRLLVPACAVKRLYLLASSPSPSTTASTTAAHAHAPNNHQQQQPQQPPAPRIKQEPFNIATTTTQMDAGSPSLPHAPQPSHRMQPEVEAVVLSYTEKAAGQGGASADPGSTASAGGGFRWFLERKATVSDEAGSSSSQWDGDWTSDRISKHRGHMALGVESTDTDNGDQHSHAPGALLQQPAWPSSSAAAETSISVSSDGSKLVVAFRGTAQCMDSETLAVLRKVNAVPESHSAATAYLSSGRNATWPGDSQQGVVGQGTTTPSYDNGGAGLAIETPPPSSPQQQVLASTVCFSANSCCLCFVTEVGRPRQRRRRQSGQGDGTAASGRGRLNGGGDEDTDMADAEAAAAPNGDESFAAAANVYGNGGGGDYEAEADEAGWDEDGRVLLELYTVQDVATEGGNGSGGFGAGNSTTLAHGGNAVYGNAGGDVAEDAVSCNLDTMRLAWGLLHKLSLWDVAERLRCRWRAGQRAHVARCLDQLDGLLYGHEEFAVRGALAPGVTRAKLEVLRRLPDPHAALVAADLLAHARTVQYSQALSLLYSQQSEALSNPETRALAAHMVWFVLEVCTLMMAAVRIWAEEQSGAGPSAGGAGAGAAGDAIKQEGGGAAGGGGGSGGGGNGAATAAEGAGGGGGGGGTALLPLLRLYPDYQLMKQMQLALLGTSLSNAASSKSSAETRASLGLHAAIQEVLGSEAGVRVRSLIHISLQLQHRAPKLLNSHLQALLHQQQQQQSGGSAGSTAAAAAPAPGVLVPGAAVAPVTAAEVQDAAKSGDLPRALMHRTLAGLFPGPFHVHCVRCKGLITAASLAQNFRQEELSRMTALLPATREALLERYRGLGLQQQLLESGPPAPGKLGAPHAASRELWRSFRCAAPFPELHAAQLPPHPAADSSQRQRWRRQRSEAMALASSAPLWSHTHGVPAESLSGAPLPSGAVWSLEA